MCTHFHEQILAFYSYFIHVKILITIILRALLMNQELSFKSFILFFLAWTIIVVGLFFGVHETLEHSDQFSILAEDYSDSHSLPLHDNLYIRSDSSFIVSVSEVRDVRAVSEVLKRIENNSSSKRIVILSLIICILISEGAFYTSVLPSIYPWTSFISSRHSIMCYIHNQDGAK